MGQESKNYYDLLAVLPSASMLELKRAYREKAKSFHPDLNPGEDAQAHFRRIQEAYNILRDPVERTFYDRGLGLKSNWVEEAAKDSDRKRAFRATTGARGAADAAESAEPTADDTTGSRETRGAGPRRTTRRSTAGFSDTSSRRTASGPSTSGSSGAPRSEPSASATGGAPRSESRPSGGQESPRAKSPQPDAPTSDGSAQEPPKSTASESRGSMGGRPGAQGASRPNPGARTSTADDGARRRRTSRFSSSRPQGAPSAADTGRPSEAYPPPPRVKPPWYKDRPLRIFLFASNLLVALVFFFTAPDRGIYFLMLAFGVEMLYRLDDLKDRGLTPPPFRPPPRP